MIIRAPFFLLLFCISIQANAQNIESMLEEYEDLETGGLESIIRTFIDKPIRINEVSLDSLIGLWFFELDQIQALTRLYTESYPNISLQQISVRLDLSMDIVKAIFSTKTRTEMSIWGRNRTIRRVDEGWQQQVRFDLERGRASGGVITEKDAGESRLTDFTSGFVRYDLSQEQTSLTLGDFTAQTGLGLVAAGAFGSSSLSSPSSILRFTQPRVKPFRSVNENLAFRGIALEKTIGPVRGFLFAARSPRDARISAEDVVTSLPRTGYHRSTNELAGRDALRETSFGASLAIAAFSNSTVGVNFFRHSYDLNVFPPDTVRNRFAFRGTANPVYGFFIQSGFRENKLQLLLDAARNSGANAVVAGARIRRNRSKITLAWWRADPGFDNAFGALPGEFIGETSNRKAFYFGLETRRGFGGLTFFIAKLTSLWRTFFNPQPVSNEKFGLQWERRLFRGTNLLARFRYSTASATAFTDTLNLQRPGNILLGEKSYSWRMQLQSKLHRALRYRYRIDLSHQTGEFDPSETGLSQIHELRLKKRPATATFRYTYFSIPSFDSRIYQVEYQLPGAVRAIALSGEGERIFGQISLKLFTGLKLGVYAYHMRRRNARSSNQIGFQIDFFSQAK